MITKPQRLAAVLMALLVGLVIAGSASSSAISETHHFTFPNNFTLTNPCTGHPIAFTGEFDAVVHVTITDSGHITVASPGHPSHTVGTDLVTGEVFRYVGVSGSEQSLDISGYPIEFTINLIAHFVGQGPGNNLIQHELIHMTIDANGDTTASVHDVSIECR